MSLQRRPDGCLTVVTGATRTGKTAWTSQQVSKAKRLLVWDSVGEFSDKGLVQRITRPSDLAQALGSGAQRIGYVAPCNAVQFDFFCRAAWLWIKHAPGAIVVEELADVTGPSKAPPAWGELIRKGLRYGPDIYALTQRPAESDKTCFGNATVLHCHQMVRLQDRRYMASELDCDPELVDQLKPLQWIERDRRSGSIKRGMVKFLRK